MRKNKRNKSIFKKENKKARKEVSFKYFLCFQIRKKYKMMLPLFIYLNYL